MLACLGTAHAFVPNALAPSPPSVRAHISPASPLALRMSSETTQISRRGAVAAATVTAFSWVAFPREGVADRSYTSMTVNIRPFSHSRSRVFARKQALGRNSDMTLNPFSEPGFSQTATRKYIPKIKEVIAFYEADLKDMIVVRSDGSSC